MLCSEIRVFLVDKISKTGGHLASNLGTVELTVALNLSFNLPDDKLVFDVGHQCYTHKILTNRADRFDTLRQKNGISGFPKPNESEYDSFISGHASTSISAAFGIAKAFELQGKNNYAVAIIGDGAFTGGLAYEALNNAGRSKAKLIIVVNHNDMSISKNVGGFARYLSNIRYDPGYLKLKKNVAKILNKTPLVGKPMISWLENSKSTLKAMLYRSTFFEELGFSYYGPVDGHDLSKLTRMFENAKNSDRPVVIQVETKKGKGYSLAEQNPGAYHATSKFDIINGGDDVTLLDCYSNTVGKYLTQLATDNEKICAITAAMKYGTGLHGFAATHRSRFFDVGIAEGYATTFAGGLASQGLIPVFCVYSTFLQRSYDNILHDLAIDRKHVLLCIDRAGVVGEDGETHQGIFDVAFLSTIPKMTIYSPEGYEETKLCIKHAVEEEKGVVAVRYPRGKDTKVHDLPVSKDFTYLDNHSKSLIISYGRVFSNCFKAVESLKAKNMSISMIKLTKLIPFDKNVFEISKRYDRIYFVEEGIKAGSIAQQLSALLTEQGYNGKFFIRAIDNQFVAQGNVDLLLEDLGLDEISIEKFIMSN